MANRVNSFNVQGNTYGVEADLTFDSSPTIGSSNPVTSNGIAQAIQSVTLGDSISYGRTDGTPVGYCSISYGENNSATCSYGVSIGKNNVNTSYCGITIGDSNAVAGGIYNLAAGNYNSCLGQSNVAIGWGCQAGTRVGNFSTTPPAEPDYNAKVFIGYVNISSKKIYYDPDMENQITVTISTNESCYFVDKTEGQPNRAPGDIYEYKRTASYTYTLTKIATECAWFSNRCSSRVYIYRGISYYDAANDRNYLNYNAGTFSNDLETLQAYYERARVGQLFFDAISGNFVTFVYTDFDTIGNATKIHWLKVKVYKAASAWDNAPNITRSNVLNNIGTAAYIYTGNTDQSKKYKVFSRPDFGDDSDITNTILDGQIIIDMSDTSGGTKGRYYVCDIDGVPRVSRYTISNTGYPDGFWNTGMCIAAQGAILFGEYNKTTGGDFGNIICGNACEVRGATEGLAVFGLENTVEMGNGVGGQCCSLIAGRSVSIKSHTVQSHTAFAYGHSIYINSDPYSGSDRWFVMGANISMYQYYSGADYFIFGSYLDINTISKSVVFGHNHYVYDLQYPYTFGYGNKLYGIPKTVLTRNKSGIWEGEGVTYDASTGTYSFPQNKLFLLRGIKTGWSSGDYNYDRTEIGFLGYAKSTDGTTLTNVPGGIPTTAGYPLIMGTMNTYKIDTDISPLSVSGSDTGYCTIFGNHNTMQWRSNYYGINAYGTYLDISGDINKNSMFLGAYNTMTGTTGAMFTVGIGNSSTRKNGFVIFDSGVMAAPSSPDTITGGTSAMATTGLNSDKMVVTYGMMKDYTGPGGGGSSRPHVDTVTLASADWDGSTFEQTVSLTGMTAGAIVIIQPIGSPQQFNYHNVYLDSQGDDELTFKCTTTPSLDISVKVVYWV